MPSVLVRRGRNEPPLVGRSIAPVFAAEEAERAAKPIQGQRWSYLHVPEEKRDCCVVVIEIRGFSPDDEAAVRELLRKHGWEDQYIDGQLEALSDLAGSGSTFRAVSIAGGSLVGFVSSRYYAWNQLAQIHGLAVDPARLRSGIGTRLIVAAEEHGRGEGARGMYVDTPVDNEIARHFYLANGYADAYAMPRYYSDELDGVTFVKFFA